ncbi:MAG TPA: 4'-phosphopantetheinyl transferase superfamily protein [Gemmatimonadaceae bacterium]|nr:4'-phosphopantetheinyl transferase superfamily protein [Gemmatimonadaceae bacterium]
MPTASAPAITTLSPVDIHVWHVSLDLTPSAVTDAARLLPQAEREKTALVAGEAQRARLTLSRGLVRGILAGYLEKSAPEIAIRRSSRGKPFVIGEGDAPPLHFSVSHAGDHMLVCVTRSEDVGVDLERMTRVVDVERIAARFFSPAEYEALVALDRQERADAFFRAWVRKEAVVKALGTGIASAFDAFAVPMGRDQTVEVDVGRVAQANRQRLWVHSLDVGRVDYLAAVAFGQPDANIRMLEWK